MKRLVVLLFSTVSFTCFALPSIEEIREISRRVKSEYQHLSPIHATVALETGHLKRLTQLGNETEATTQLLHHLFKIQDDRLHPYNNLSKPAAHFTPEIIADLVTALQRKTLASDYQTTWQPELLKKVNAELKKTSRGRMTATKLGAFLDTLKRTQEECEQSKIKRFLPYTALLGYLCLKASSGQDIVDCFHHMKSNGIDVISESAPPAMTVPQALHETALYTEIDRKYYKGTLPPMAKSNDVTFEERRAHDCTDTLLRNFFNHLFYNNTTHRFDPEKLPPTVNPSPQLLDFYRRYSTPSDVNSSPTISHDWVELMAGRPHVIYRFIPGDSRHSIVRPFLCNVVSILNQLLGTKGEKVAQLCQLLSTEQRTLKSTREKKGEKDTIYITVKEEGQEYILSMETIPLHAFMQRHIKQTTTREPDDQKKVRHALLNMLASSEYNQDTHNLLSVYLNQNYEDLKRDIEAFITNNNIPYENLLDFYYMLDVKAAKVDLIHFDSVCSKLRQYPQLKTLLLHIIFDPHDDDAFYYYIKYFAKHKVWEVAPEFNGIIKNCLDNIKNETYHEKARAVLLQNGYEIQKPQD